MARKDLYCVTIGVALGFSLCGLIRRITHFSLVVKQASSAKDLFLPVSSAVIWLEYCRYGVKHKAITRSIKSPQNALLTCRNITSCSVFLVMFYRSFRRLVSSTSWWRVRKLGAVLEAVLLLIAFSKN